MTHFLDVKGKIADLMTILREYEIALDKAIDSNDAKSMERYRQLIQETKNKIEGMRNSDYY